MSGHSFGGSPPWQRTETRQPCADFALLRRPLFGETHLHTTFSIDAVLLNRGRRDAARCPLELRSSDERVADAPQFLDRLELRGERLPVV
jgi:hypothetical protein